MRKNPTKRLEDGRVTNGLLASCKSDGANGAFFHWIRGQKLLIIASDGRDWAESGLPQPAWEHVSVSLSHRCPTWDEMDEIKRIFWRDDETVMQLHVPRESHINKHEYCLHMWKPVDVEIPLPPLACV